MPGRSMPGLVGTGTKRKRDEAEDALEGGPRLATCSQVCSYTLQRQCVLNLSVCKLQMSRQQIEPPLRRSVLICNTLRQIERELRAEGRHYDCSRVAMLISNQPMCLDTPNKESIPSSRDAGTNATSPSPDSRGCLTDRNRANGENANPAGQRTAQPPADEASLLLTDRRFQTDGATVDCTSKPASVPENNNCLQPIANRTNVPSLLQPVTTHQVSNGVAALQARHTDNKLTPITLSQDTMVLRHDNNSCLDTPPTLNAASTDIMDFGDEIFNDIDVSLYDFDLASPFIPTHTPNPNPKPTLSPTSAQDDWIVGFAGDMTSAGAQGNCRSDLIDDLDQIMHILVDVGM